MKYIELVHNLKNLLKFVIHTVKNMQTHAYIFMLVMYIINVCKWKLNRTGPNSITHFEIMISEGKNLLQKVLYIGFIIGNP